MRNKKDFLKFLKVLLWINRYDIVTDLYEGTFWIVLCLSSGLMRFEINCTKISYFLLWNWAIPWTSFWSIQSQALLCVHWSNCLQSTVWATKNWNSSDSTFFAKSDSILVEGGLPCHVDRNPYAPFDNVQFFRPIQASLALTDHLDNESGGLMVVKGFHKESDQYFQRHRQVFGKLRDFFVFSFIPAANDWRIWWIWRSS